MPARAATGCRNRHILIFLTANFAPSTIRKINRLPGAKWEKGIGDKQGRWVFTAHGSTACLLQELWPELLEEANTNRDFRNIAEQFRQAAAKRHSQEAKARKET